eukprot:gene10369-10527_t
MDMLLRLNTKEEELDSKQVLALTKQHLLAIGQAVERVAFTNPGARQPLWQYVVAHIKTPLSEDKLVSFFNKLNRTAMAASIKYSSSAPNGMLQAPRQPASSSVVATPPRSSRQGLFAGSDLSLPGTRSATPAGKFIIYACIIDKASSDMSEGDVLLYLQLHRLVERLEGTDGHWHR